MEKERTSFFVSKFRLNINLIFIKRTTLRANSVRFREIPIYYFILQEPVARSLVFINGERSSCRVRSCSLGNMVADAVVKQQQQQPSNTQWATITLGIWNAGGIRSGSIDKTLQGTDI